MLPPVPPGDPGRPSSARVYSYLHGGNDWYGPDRDLAVHLEGIYPGVRRMAATNRLYIQHATLYAVARLGITQFLDLGCGFPDSGSVRAHAQAADPDSVIACVDLDPVVAGPDGYGPLLDEQGVKGVTVTLADIRDPAAVLACPGVAGLLDLSRPVMAVLGLVLHTMTLQQAREVVAGYTAGLAPGSAVVITVSRNDDEAVCGPMREAWEAATRTEFSNFTDGELGELFAGLDVQPPGIGPVSGSRPGWAKGSAPGTVYVIGAIGVKP